MPDQEPITLEALAQRYAANIAVRVPLLYQQELKEELTDHILESAEDMIARGVQPERAVIRAAEHLGDPDEVARNYRLTYCKPRNLSMDELFCSDLNSRLTYGAGNRLELCLYFIALALLVLICVNPDGNPSRSFLMLLTVGGIAGYILFRTFHIRRLRRSALFVCGSTVTVFTCFVDLSDDFDAYIGSHFLCGLNGFNSEDLLATRVACAASSSRMTAQDAAERNMHDPVWLRRLLKGRNPIQMERWYDCAFARATRFGLYFTGSRTPNGSRKLFRIPNVYRTIRENETAV